jgi:large subunit ribosomal protein L18|tara:strand:- start:1031 stop:1387 length:357 start_codon:yes stop_codon:yes gene_type:complete
MKLDEINKKKLRVRNKLRRSNKNSRLRLTVNRSSKNISAQIIDDINNKTLVAASSVEKDIKKKNKTKKSDMSLFVGEALAKRANEKNISKVYFDKGIYKYHGRVKLLTDALRKHGLEF